MYQQKKEGRILIVSNRLPVKIAQQDTGVVFTQSVGGLATGLSSLPEGIQRSGLDGQELLLGVKKRG
jgi:trehalose-6-phosphate synthase